MSEPYRDPPGTDPLGTNRPGTNPPRHVRPANHNMTWTIVAIAAALVAGVIFWEVNNRDDRSASTEPDTTIGRSERLAPTVVPANPNRTQPQIDPQPDPVRPVPSR
jgi:hypothetical protein